MTPAISALEAAGIPFGIHEYERGRELTDFGREAAEALGLPHEQVFKTLVMASAEFVAIAVIPVDRRLSLRAAAVALGAKKLVMCDPTLAERATGYVVGGISPIGQKRRHSAVVDASASMQELIYVSGGRRGLDVSVAPADLIRIIDAVVAPVAG